MIGRKWWTPWLWLSPSLILLGVFLVYPTIDTFRRSFLDKRSEKFVGFDDGKSSDRVLDAVLSLAERGDRR